MISLRVRKNEFVPAEGIRSRKTSFYESNQPDYYSISRSKFSDFLKCQRCFYLDRVRGLVRPGMPGLTLNQTTDLLLKREFDECRAKQVPHRIMRMNGLDHVVPFEHPKMDHWRNSLRGGLEVRYRDSNIILRGGIDDIWHDTKDDKLIVVEYKSQASSEDVVPEDYLSSVYRKAYAIQMDFYAYLLGGMEFAVSPTAYFCVCNADRSAAGLAGKMLFKETLVPYSWSSDWIEPEIKQMISILNSPHVPDGNPNCETCAYARQCAPYYA